MSEYYTTEDLMEPIEVLEVSLAAIQNIYNKERIKDRENAERLIDSYRYAIELLRKEEAENDTEA